MGETNHYHNLHHLTHPTIHLLPLMSPPQRVQMWPTPMKKARDSMGWEQVLPRKWGELIGGAVYVDALHLCAPHNSCRNKENKYAYKCKYLHSQVTQWPQLQFFILTASVTKHYKTEYPFYSYLWAQGLHSNDAFIFFLDVFKYEIRIKKKTYVFGKYAHVGVTAVYILSDVYGLNRRSRSLGSL